MGQPKKSHWRRSLIYMSETPAPLLNKPSNEMSADELNSVVDIYKILIDMADKVSQRRQNANSFYLSVNTAITGASAYLSATTVGAANVLVISLAGILVCLSWKRSID